LENLMRGLVVISGLGYQAMPAATLHVIAMCGHLPTIEKPLVMAELLRVLLASAG
jgi:hypothetical protein